MCITSAVIDQWQQPYQPWGPPPSPQPFTPNPNYIPFTPVSPSPDLARQMLEIIERLDAIDKKLGNLECKLQEEQKQALIEKLQQRAAE